MRRMSCALTIPQVVARTKTVTRRAVDTWVTLSVGDELALIEKGMGLPKGSQQVILAHVVVTSVRVEPIGLLASDVRYGRQEVALEGFAGYDPAAWAEWWCQSHHVDWVDDQDRWGRALCRRIEWRYQP